MPDHIFEFGLDILKTSKATRRQTDVNHIVIWSMADETFYITLGR